MSLASSQEANVHDTLSAFQIELPSWSFANTGTRFGKFLDPAAARTISEKIADAGQTHLYAGCCPSIGLHAAWDVPTLKDVASVQEQTAACGLRIGSISPTLFEDQDYKFGSLGNPDAAVRKKALSHLLHCVQMSRAIESKDVTLWFADGSDYPGTANLRRRRAWFQDGLRSAHDSLSSGQRLLVEYKPFEPAFYHTDIADWGMAFLLAKKAGPQAKVLVDLGHHYQGQNIEQIVAWLLDENMLGGFHFNDRRHADDDLTVGSIDPYQVFRILHEILYYSWEKGETPDISYMVDQSDNLKPKIEAMIQTVTTAQELLAKAVLVDHAALARYQDQCDLIGAEEILRRAFNADVLPLLESWRERNRLPKDPLKAFRESGYRERVIQERAACVESLTGSYV